MWFSEDEGLTFPCFLCAFRDAAVERCRDDVPLRHLHLHRAAAPGSPGLQRSIPEGTLICPLFSRSVRVFSLVADFITQHPPLLFRSYNGSVHSYPYVFKTLTFTKKGCWHTPSVELSPAETSAPTSHRQGLLPWKLTGREVILIIFYSILVYSCLH